MILHSDNLALQSCLTQYYTNVRQNLGSQIIKQTWFFFLETLEILSPLDLVHQWTT